MTPLLILCLLLPPILFALSYVLRTFWKYKKFLGVGKGLVVNILTRQQGNLPSSWPPSDDEGKVAISKEMKERLSKSDIEWKVDPENYNTYLLLCGYDSTSERFLDPACYPETAFILPYINIISKRDFPLSPLALIHMAQTIKVYHPFSFENSPNFNLDCGLSSLRVVDKGVEVYLYSKVYKNDLLLYEGSITLLSRNKSTRNRNRKGTLAKRRTDDSEDSLEEETESVAFNVPEGVGWEYAKVSSDYNPHHLNSFTSKLVGYPRPMIHGLWTLSRVMAILNSKVGPISSHYPLVIGAQFKRPLFIPSVAELRYQSIEYCPVATEDTKGTVGEYCLKGESKAFKYQVLSKETSNHKASDNATSVPSTSVNMIGFVTYNANV